MEPKKEPSSTMIYVSNLPFSTNDESLLKLFDGLQVKTAYVATRRNGRSKGFGFVNLVNSSDQKAAIERIEGKEVDGRKITAKVAFNDERRDERGELKEQFKKELPTKGQGAPSETVVYISNIPWAFKDEDLKGLFADLKVKSANVATRRNGRSKGFGFVEFESKEEQNKALLKDQTKIEERIITVKVSVNYRGAEAQNAPKTPTKRPQKNSQKRTTSTNSTTKTSTPKKTTVVRTQGKPKTFERRSTENTLYVSNLPFDLDNTDLEQIFSEFNVKSAHVAVRSNGKSKGFGFVEFNNEKDQKSALEALDQSEVNERVIAVKIATGKPTDNNNGPRNNNNNNNNNGPRRNNNGPRNNNNNNTNGPRSNSQKSSTKRPPRTQEDNREPSTTTLYVSNLPFSVDDKALEGIFKGFKVVKAYVAVRRNGRSKGFGFVEFASSEEQTKAISLDKHEIEGRPLTVQVAKKTQQTETN